MKRNLYAKELLTSGKYGKKLSNLKRVRAAISVKCVKIPIKIKVINV